MRTGNDLPITTAQPTALTGELDRGTERRALRPLEMECGDCGTRLRIATWWTAFRCGVCGRLTDEHGELW
jgi:hypothetical protein